MSEARELIRELAGALLDTVSELEAAQDDFKEGSYAKEMAVYDRAVAWLQLKANEMPSVVVPDWAKPDVVETPKAWKLFINPEE